eukprot:1954347-Pleurochrysis_carterae.AAC.1
MGCEGSFKLTEAQCCNTQPTCRSVRRRATVRGRKRRRGLRSYMRYEWTEEEEAFEVEAVVGK